MEIGEGANIGAEALLVGQVSIGKNACIGSATTIFNSSVASSVLIPPGSVVGDLSRPPDELKTDELKTVDTVLYPAAGSAHPTEPSPMPPDPRQSAASTLITNSEATNSEPSAQSLHVYGQVYVNQILGKMFPHHAIHPPSASSTPLPNADDPWAD